MTIEKKIIFDRATGKAREGSSLTDWQVALDTGIVQHYERPLQELTELRLNFGQAGVTLFMDLTQEHEKLEVVGEVAARFEDPLESFTWPEEDEDVDHPEIREPEEGVDWILCVVTPDTQNARAIFLDALTRFTMNTRMQRLDLQIGGGRAVILTRMPDDSLDVQYCQYEH